ncbi:hypothetical protein BGZ95_007141 [Linnemannia exigua]|uniref:F-box domain-containing protein n=1 Tax=Linnemannia exigua TaxID=604196 RepID=A0AAD4DFV6_9FUNG|nr:hypothetical protein BGZ95_007141 [Linnemannia exigua]
MDPLSKLPVECLQHILQILDNDNSLFALSGLLTMNKYIASVTVPFLYRHPYRDAFHQEGPGKRNRWRSTTPGMLTRMLLGSRSVASLPKSLALAFTSCSAITSTTSTTTTTTMTNLTFDYIGYIRRLDMRAYASLATIRSWTPQNLSSCQLTYIHSDEFDQLYQLNPFAPMYASHLSTRDHILRRYYEVMLQQDTLWSLAEPIFEQLEFFVIPHILSIKRFQQVVGRFKSLEEARFVMSMKFEYPLTRNEMVVEEMFRCVKEHLQLFKGCLKSVICLEGYEYVDKDHTARIQLDMLRLLPPLSKPTYLTKDNWLQFSAHPRSVDLTHVQEVNTWGLPESWEDVIGTNQSIFQRCRALKRINVHASRKGMFKWAAQEKIDLERNVGQGTLVLQNTSQPTHRINGLVPLERINRRCDLNMDDLDDLDDIAFAFSQSLSYLSVDVPTQGFLNPPKLFHLGRGWVDLPVLTTLCLYVNSYRLVVDPQLLSRCPNLTHLWLDDSSLEYSWEDLVPCQPARLEHLDVLSLCGWPALTFDPATLSSTSGLTSLSIQIRSWRYGNDEELAFEVAYLFEFKMLHGCPALKVLILDIYSLTPAHHTRIISEFDLLVPTTNSSICTSSTSPSSSSFSQQPMPERLCLPSLEEIALNGEWVIDDSVMPMFLAETFPNVKEVQLNRWTTTTLESLFKLFRSMPQKYDESVTLAITRLSSPQEMARLGIDRIHGDNVVRHSSNGEDFFIHFVALLKREASSSDDEDDDDDDGGDGYLGVTLELYEYLYDGNTYRLLKRLPPS